MGLGRIPSAATERTKSCSPMVRRKLSLSQEGVIYSAQFCGSVAKGKDGRSEAAALNEQEELSGAPSTAPSRAKQQTNRRLLLGTQCAPANQSGRI